jgi:hypothetical protein
MVFILLIKGKVLALNMFNNQTQPRTQALSTTRLAESDNVHKCLVKTVKTRYARVLSRQQLRQAKNVSCNSFAIFSRGQRSPLD